MRFVIDDGAFRGWDALAVNLEPSLLLFGDLLKFLRDNQISVGFLAGWGNLKVTAQADLATILSSRSSEIDRDLRLLLLGLLGKCEIWDEDPSVVVSDDGLRVHEADYASLGVAYATCEISEGRGVGVLTMVHTGLVGMYPVSSSCGDYEVSFSVRPTDCKYFYRTLYALEDVSEDDFFTLAQTAFPDLCFVDNLDFSKFDGGYSLRDAVVVHLGALNDKFTEFYVSELGNSAQISARIGIDVSIEGETRSSERLMAMRDVIFDGRKYRCEWHSKLKPHRNRIHFYPADASTRDKVLIGIFIDHLPT
jgi:hypothetical protein